MAESPAALIENPSTNAIFVLTRHSTHAEYVVSALKRGKMVFVEKPIAIDHGQIEQIRQAFEESKHNGRNPFLMVGFNRRFAPFTEKIKQFYSARTEPMVVQVRV